MISFDRKSRVAVILFVAAAVGGPLGRAQNAVTTIAVGFNSGTILVNPVTNKIYVSSGNGMVVIDGGTNATTTIANANAAAVNSVTNKIYGAGGIFSGIPNSPFVTVTDGATDAITTIAGVSGPIAVNSVTNKIYVANLNGTTVAVFDGATNAITTVTVGSNPNAIAVNPVTNKVYVTKQTGTTITVIDGATNATTAVSAGSDPRAIAVNSVTNKIYVSTDSGVTVVDGATNATTTIAVGPNPRAIAVNPVTDKVYVNVGGDNSVKVIDGATNAIASVSVGPTPSAIAVNPVTNKIYIPIYGSKFVTVIDGATNASNTIAVGNHPVSAAVNPVTNRIYVTDDSNNVTMIDGDAILVRPSFSNQPQSQTVNGGASVVFAAAANSMFTPTYQWSINGAALADGGGISGSSTSTLYLSGASVNAGIYTCAATNGAGTTTTDGATLTVVNTLAPGRLVNISARARAGTEANALIAGYIIRGSAPLPVLLRSAGPALVPLNVTGTLTDPQLKLYSAGTVIDGNTGWGGNPQVVSAASAAGAYPWNNPASKDSALLETQIPGAYTAITSGASGDTGVVLDEVYDVTPPGTWNSSLPRLGNLSARAFVGTGQDVLIAGFVIGGSTAKTVLIRASGPALIPLNVVGYLIYPQLQLYGGSTPIGGNTAWGGDGAIAAAASAAGAFAWTYPSSNDSAILVTLPPGAYSAVVSGANGDTGISLVEVYDVP